MPGFLEYLMDPSTQGMLNLSAGLMQAGGPSRMPVSFGQALGQGLHQGVGALQSSQNTGMQQEKLKQEAEMLRLHGALYGAQSGKIGAEAQRMARLQQILAGSQPIGPTQQVGLSDNASAGISAPWAAASGLPQPTVNPLDTFKARASTLANEGFLAEANQVAEFVTKMEPKLEFKDGVWYDKTSGAPVKGGAFVNQQGFGGQMTVGPNGQISAGALPGSEQLYGRQQEIGERAKAGHDLVTVPATSPNSPPTYASRLSLLPGASAAGAPAAPAARPAAGMSPAATAEQAANATQQQEIAKNYGTIYNNMQNASLSNPGKIAKVNRIGSLLGDFEGGKLSATGLEVARAANSLGLKIDSKLPNKEAAQALTNEVALELRSTADGHGMPGAMSDADREFLKAMTPQMAQTAEGRKTIIESKVKLMERENQVATMARQYKKKYGTLNEDFFTQLSEWSARNPIYKK